MKAAFADTFYYIALLNHDDAHHHVAVDVAKSLIRPIITSAWILTELADGMAEPPARSLAISMIQDLLEDPMVKIVPQDETLFTRGWELYRRRKDKGWSLTDCISFAIMRDEGIVDALTADHHFTQAGFNILLK